MQVFLSWSKELSNEIAKTFKDIFEEALGITAFKSDQDIFFGEAWFNRIKNEVHESDIAIVLITNENISIPWLNFEIGAFASKIGEGNIVPVLCDITNSDLASHPLSNLQCTNLEWSSFLAIVKQLNILSASPRAEDKLNSLIGRFKDDYENKVDAALEKFRNRKKAPNITLNDLASRISSLEKMLQYGFNGGFGANFVAAAISGQGDLATKNTIDIQNQLISPVLNRLIALENILNNNIAHTAGALNKTDKTEIELNNIRNLLQSLKSEIASINSGSAANANQLWALNAKISELEKKFQDS